MTVSELAAKAKAVYGNRWKAELAHDLGRNYATVWRWANDFTPVPLYVEQFLKLKR